MRKSRSTATDEERFAPPWLLAGLVTVTVVGFLLLFPAASLRYQLNHTQSATTVVIDYLRLLVRADPNQTTPRLMLARRALQAGDPPLAHLALLPWLRAPASQLPRRILMLRIRLAHAEMIAAEPGSTRRRERRSAYASLLDAAPGRLPEEALIKLAKTASALSLPHQLRALTGHVLRHASSAQARRQALMTGIRGLLALSGPASAMAFAKDHLSQVPAAQSPWAYLARVALQANAPRQASTYEAHALAQAQSARARTRAFYAAVRDLLRAGDPSAALALAQRHLGALPPSASLWRFMTHLATTTNRPDLAAYYASRLLRAESHPQ